MSDHPNKLTDPHKSFEELERGVLAALETYSNIHRGSGHNSVVTTHLFEQARDVVLEYLGLRKGKYVVIFCTPRGSETRSTQYTSGTQFQRSAMAHDTWHVIDQDVH